MSSNYLKPNKHVHFSPQSQCTILATSLAAFKSPEQAVATISTYISTTILYDHIKARTVRSGYLPKADEILAERKGICFDIASLFACMCRSVGIPCKLVIGHADAEYHAWNEVQIDGQWIRYDITSTITGLKFIVYKTERVY
jgi:transglutaminase-like putative cysteine protease